MVLVEGPNTIKVAPDVNVFAQVEGKGKPIVLVHGFALNHNMWRNQVPYLKEHGYRVVAIDLRGFGNSDQPQGKYDYETWANDLGKVLDQLESRNITLVGYSMGGAIATYYMTTRPDPPVERLVLVAAAGPYMSFDRNTAADHWPCGHVRTFFDGLIDLLNEEKDYEAILQFYDGVLLPLERGDFQWIQGMFKSSSLHALIGGLEEMRDKDRTEEWREIRVPTKIIGGWIDTLVPWTLVEEQSLITDTTQPTMLEGGHGIFFEQAGELNRALTGEGLLAFDCPIRWCRWCPVRYICVWPTKSDG